MWNKALERDILRPACRDNFRTFLMEAFGVGHNPKGTWYTPEIHDPICDWFQQQAEAWLNDDRPNDRQRHIAVLVPREVGKTTLITKAGLLWLHLQDPDISTFIGSEKTEFAIDFLQSVKMVIDGSDPYARFPWLYGNWCNPSRTWKTDQLVHAARTNLARGDQSFGTWGVEAGLTGKHPDVLCLDDPTSYEKMASHANWLRTVNDHMTSLIPVLSRNGMMILVGTRYHDGDHFGTAFKLEGIRSNAGMPVPGVNVDPNGKWHVYYLAARDSEGKPTIPTIWPEQRLKEFENKDPLRYAAQVMNDPSSSKHNPLPRRMAERCVIDPKEVPLRRLFYSIHMDTAFKDPAKQQAYGDENVIQIWGHTRDGSGDVYFIEGYGSNTWRIEDFTNRLVSLVQKYRRLGLHILCMTDEVVTGKDASWEQVLKSAFAAVMEPMPYFIKVSRAGKKKLARMTDATSFWIDGHVHIPRDAPGIDQLFDQMTKIGSSINDDWADCAADVFHKDVYQIMHRGRPHKSDDDQNYAPQPWDEVLKARRTTPANEAQRLIDKYGGLFDS